MALTSSGSSITDSCAQRTIVSEINCCNVPVEAERGRERGDFETFEEFVIFMLEDFTRELGDPDVFGLQETWSRRDISTGCPLAYRDSVFPSTKLKGVNPGQGLRYKPDLVHSIWLKDIFMSASESPYYNENRFCIPED